MRRERARRGARGSGGSFGDSPYRYSDRSPGEIKRENSHVAELLWTPSSERIERANITQFARKHGLPEDYGSLWQWSVDHLDEFWAAIWDEYVDADAPYERVLGRRGMPGAEWFPGARLNYAKHIFRGR